MAPLLIGLLTFIMILACLVLVLLVLIQLPKKEAGVGVAFGGAATDALFGAGSGNVLTKATKYAAVSFFILAIILSVMQRHYFRGGNTGKFRQEYDTQSQPLPPAETGPASPAITAETNSVNNFLLSPSGASNAPVNQAATNGSPATNK